MTRNAIRLILLGLVLIGLSDRLTAQLDIRGQVIDRKGQGLPGASVYIQGTFDGTSSDADGVFRFRTHVSLPCTLRVDYLGFEDQSIVLDDSIISSSILVSMEEEFNQLKAVTITAGAFRAGDAEKAVVLKPLDIVTTAGATGDVVGAMQTLPGTTTVGESGRLFVRGGSAMETGTYVDGMLVHEPYTRSAPNTAVRGRFNPFIFSGTNFTTGGYSAEYGQALSSVLLMDTKGIEQEDEWNVSLMTVGADAAGTKTWTGGSVTASLLYIDLTPYAQVIPQNLSFERLPQVFNGSLSLRQETAGQGLLKVYANRADSRFGIHDHEPGSENRSLVQGGDDNTYLNSSWRGVLSERWVLKGGLAHSSNEDARSIDGYRYEQSTRGQHAKAVAIYIPSEKLSIRMGSEFYQRSLEERYGTERLGRASFTDRKWAMFGESDTHLSNDLGLRAGLRLEHTLPMPGVQEALTLAPRISAAQRVGNDGQISLAVGRFYQDAEQRTLLYSEGVGQQRADHLILGYQYRREDRILRVEGYHKEYSGLVRFQQDEEGIYNYDNLGDGYAQGLDIWWRDEKTIRNGDYWVSYSFIDTERQFRDWSESVVPGFAAAHNFSFVYKHWIQDWRSLIGMAFSYTSGRPYDDPNLPGIQESRMQADHPLNLNWSYLFREHVIFYAAVTNVLGQNRQFGYRFASEADQQGVFQSAPIRPAADRFIFIGCFITFSKDANNQLDKIQ